MKKILIIEDDELVANIYRNKFAVEGFRVEIARDGAAGFESVRTFRPDAVVLDLMLPRMSGVDLMRKLRTEPDFAKLPIIVFSNTYLTRMVEEAWKAGATKCLTKANCTPKQLIEVVRGTLSHNGASPAAIPAPVPPPVPTAAVPKPPRPTPVASPAVSPEADEQFQAGLRETFTQSLPATLAALRTFLQGLIKADNEAVRLNNLDDLYRRIHALAANAAVASVPQIALMAEALEALLKELQAKPKHINASTLRTVASAVDCLGILFERGLAQVEQAAPAPRVLVVDDEAISRRAMIFALEKAKLKCVTVEDSALAFGLLAQTKFDLILLDVDMPGMNGFELCTKLRNLPAHKKTPVVFVTRLNSFESRANSTMSGGNDFIAKPFLFIELAVKALVHLLRGRLQAVR